MNNIVDNNIVNHDANSSYNKTTDTSRQTIIENKVPEYENFSDQLQTLIEGR